MDLAAWHDSVRSQEELRFQWVAEQATDTSCGYASVATLLDLYWDQDTSEAQLLALAPSASGEGESVSLASLKRALESSGFEARGYRMDYAHLSQVVPLHAPVLVHYDRPQKHFALVLGVQGTRVVTADPSRGLEVLDRQQFEARWSGVALFVANTLAVRQQARVEAAVHSALARAGLLEHEAAR
ncbi:MAG: cysteine peptidase family C39 domain-containing protein [Spirochaetales bacterium]